jgi:hypothetical protein
MYFGVAAVGDLVVADAVAMMHGETLSRSAFAHASLVVAHPDDEVLWASSIAGTVAEVVICYEDCPTLPDLGEARRRAIAEYALPVVHSLGLVECGSFGRASWIWPRQTGYGLAVGELEAAYRAKYAELYQLLSQRLKDRPIVITHNPWGEYGHEDHVQVFRVIEHLQRELGFSLWVTSYVDRKSQRLMKQLIGATRAVSQPQQTDLALAHRVRDLCIRHGCWTWWSDYDWPKQEYFLLIAGDPGGVPTADTAPGTALTRASAPRSPVARAAGRMFRLVRP